VAALDASPIITDHSFTILNDHFHLPDTTAVALEYLTNDYGRSFKLDAAFNITGARVDYCRLYDDSLGTFLDEDGVAGDLADGNVYIVPVPGPGVNDYIAFGLSSPTKRLDVVIAVKRAVLVLSPHTMSRTDLEAMITDLRTLVEMETRKSGLY